MPAAARRHHQAAEMLLGTERMDVAGYLYGIAAECAVKVLVFEAGICPLPECDRGKDPYFKHFPELRTVLRNGGHGRRAAVLLRFVENDSFLNNWAITMRYSDGKAVQFKWVEAWAEQAKQAVAAIGTQGR